jgi:transposase
MSKTFRPWNVEQHWLLPPSVEDFVPAGHLAHFVRDTVRETLDLSSILSAYEEERGYPPYHPAMMTALLLYGYSQGIYSSRRLAKACEERVDVMAVTGMSRPDFRTISDFRKRHLKALSGLFVQVLELCRAAGLVKLGHVALDGTKIKANASKHKAMSYGRMGAAEEKLAAEVADWMAKAQAADASEDGEHGADRRGDEMPDWVANKQKRLAKIREAKAALEAQAKAEAAVKAQAKAETAETPLAKAETAETPQAKAEATQTPQTEVKPQASGAADASGKKGKAAPSGMPDAKAQRNFTDPESRIMKTKDGFIQGFNGQAAVDAASQVIVAQALSPSGSDKQQLAPMVAAIVAANGRTPDELSADAGYCSEANLAMVGATSIDAYIATGRQKHGAADATGEADAKPGTRTLAMQQKLRADGFEGPYRLRKQTVEPVFGQIKQARGFRQFLLRGLEQVKSEWSLICTVHNLLKLAAASRKAQATPAIPA